MVEYYVSQIDWDTNGGTRGLPDSTYVEVNAQEVDFSDPDTVYDKIRDTLSDQYGFWPLGFQMDVVVSN